MERLLRRRERMVLTYRELSEESGIPVPTLAWWSRKLEQERENATPPDASKIVAVEVIEDSAEEESVAIEIVVSGRLMLLVPAMASERQLRRVLRAIASC
jgi:transcriptional regulator with XRE-family HTH domain